MSIMSFASPQYIYRVGFASQTSSNLSRIFSYAFFARHRRRFNAVSLSVTPKSDEELLLVVGGGAAGMYGAINAKTVAPNLKVVVIEKAKPLSKVKISGGGRCNVTNGHYADHMLLADNYPRGNKELRGSFFTVHGPMDTMSWFSNNGVELKVTFPKVKAKLKLEALQKNVPQLTQVGPMLVTHWGLSGPVILRLSAWGARYLASSDYKGTLLVDFAPDHHIDDLKSVLIKHKNQFARQKLLNSCPMELGLVKRFWKYILDREGLDGDILWSSISNNLLMSIVFTLKHCSFTVKGKGQFKDEFVTAGGVPLSEIYLNTMQSRIHPCLYFAGEVLNVDGITGGFNFQNAWSGGYIAGTSIGNQSIANIEGKYVCESMLGDKS